MLGDVHRQALVNVVLFKCHHNYLFINTKTSRQNFIIIPLRAGHREHEKHKTTSDSIAEAEGTRGEEEVEDGTSTEEEGEAEGWNS